MLGFSRVFASLSVGRGRERGHGNHTSREAKVDSQRNLPWRAGKGRNFGTGCLPGVYGRCIEPTAQAMPTRVLPNHSRSLTGACSTGADTVEHRAETGNRCVKG